MNASLKFFSFEFLKLGFVCSILLASLVSQAELVIVYSDAAELYRHNRLERTLRYGQIVRAKPQKNDPDWINVKIKDGVYVSRKAGFRSLGQIEDEVGNETAALTDEVSDISNFIQTNNSIRELLYISLLQVTWDRTAYFRVPTHKAGGKASRALREERANSDNTSLHRSRSTRRYHRVEKLPLRTANQLTRQWEVELGRLQKANLQLRDERLSHVHELALKNARLSEFKSIFLRYKKSPRTYRQNHYLVVKKFVTLYKGQTRAGELYTGDIAIGRPDVKDPDRLKILRGDHWFDSPGSSYRSWSKIEVDRHPKMSRIRRQISDVEDEVNLLTSRITLVDSYIEDLSHTIRSVGKFPICHYDTNHGIHRIRSSGYWVNVPTHGVEVVSRLRARRTIKKWKKEREQLTLKHANLGESLQLLEDKLESLDSEYNQLVKRFDTLAF